MKPAQVPSDQQTKLAHNDLSSFDIDDHAAFWSTYEKVASDHDAELLDGWNKSLDILLIFAALFSAINTAFIVESYKGLQQDPAETTNALLRILITHRADNITLPEEILNPSSVNSSIIPVNSFFFTSLSLSLTAAFGAVTAKQWLTEYAKAGSTRAIHKQCRVRQGKFDGLEKWRFPFIIDLLPLLLQLSLLVFLVGVIQFIWTLERRIAVMELVFSAAGLGLYLTTIVIAMAFPTSPFQTPLSSYLQQTFVWLLRTSQKVRRKIGSLGTTLSFNSTPRHTGSHSRWWNDGRLGFLPAPLIDSISQTWRRLRRGVNGFSARYLHVLSEPLTSGELTTWSSRDELAAGTVVWMLEHSDHSDATIAALDAALRLPGDLIFMRINQRDGLWERLFGFHLNLTSLALDASNREWEDRLIIAQMALFHLVKLDGGFDYLPDLPSDHLIPLQVLLGGKGGHHYPEALKSQLSEVEALRSVIVRWSQVALTCPETCQSLLQPRTLKIGLNMTKQNSAANNIVSSVIPAHLAVEAMTCAILLGHMSSIPNSSWDDNKWSSIAQGLRVLLDSEPSWSTISHAALAVAAMHWITPPREGRWCYTSTKQEIDLEHLLKRSIYAPDKGKLVLHNVALALSLVDPYSPHILFKLLGRLVSLTEHEFCQVLKSEDKSCRSHFPHFPESLLRLSRKLADNAAEWDTILRILGTCKGWASSSSTEYAQDIIQLFRTKFSAGLDSSTPSDDSSPLYRVTAAIAGMQDPQLFRDVFLSEDGVIAFSYNVPAWAAIQPVYSAILVSVPFKFGGPSAYIRECQIDLALKWLTRLHGSLAKGDEECQLAIETLVDFLKDVILDFDLKWPAYFPSDFIAINYKRGHQTQHSFIDHLRHYHLEHVWIGDMVLMLRKAAHEAFKHSWLPGGWNDFAFFEPDVVDLMLLHEDHL
ncbi:hypothetical protein FRC02_002025, partial [Tulasnella sp. 418]